MEKGGIISASQKLIRGLSSKFIGDPYIAEAAVLVPSQFRNSPGSPNWFFGPNGIDYKFIFEGATSATKAFNMCPPLAAVITRKTQAYINGITTLLNTQKKEAAGADAKKILALLKNPNPLTSAKDFEAQMYMFIQLYGFCPVLPIYPAGFEQFKDASQASSLWIIPPYMISYKEKQTTMWYKAAKPSDIVEKLLIHYKDLKVEIDIDDLFIFKDFTPSFESAIFPGSRIRPLAMPINNVIGAYESRNELINYAGSQGVLTPTADGMGPLPLREGEKEQLQADFKRQYGIKRGQSRYIISPTPVDWKQMGRPTKDLMLFEEIIDDIMRICDAYNYPSPLLNSDKGPSVSNTKEFKAQVYQDAIIPESLSIYEQWGTFFKLDGKNLTIVKTYDHLPVLQSDQVDDGKSQLSRNQAYLIAYQNDGITLNAWRELMGYDKTPDGDVYYSQSAQKKAADAATLAQTQARSNSTNQNPSDDEDDDKKS